jgi:hypothetical protein
MEYLYSRWIWLGNERWARLIQLGLVCASTDEEHWRIETSALDEMT